ncbi:hypothetical protein JKP88DRAFT_252520 [Tribonema minus]|uniref:PGG domain-containing protein n=1 Tax=Tribonema minus TaxID=303371 RepID=A0A835ZA81_9STRA|nr:hypothetical protein JKP88DRAFT_252520 [Tribonema minus]
MVADRGPATRLPLFTQLGRYKHQERGAAGLTTLDLEHCSNVEVLDVSGCSTLTKLPASVSHMSSLELLDVTGCEGIELIPDLFGCLLAEVRLRDCSRLRAVPRMNWTHGLEVDVSGCDRVAQSVADNTDNTLNAVLVAAALLATLGYSSITNPTDWDDTVGTPDSLQNHGDARVALLATFLILSQVSFYSSIWSIVWCVLAVYINSDAERTVQRGGESKREMLDTAIWGLGVAIVAILAAYLFAGLTMVTMSAWWLVVFATFLVFAASMAVSLWVAFGGSGRSRTRIPKRCGPAEGASGRVRGGGEGASVRPSRCRECRGGTDKRADDADDASAAYCFSRLTSVPTLPRRAIVFRARRRVYSRYAGDPYNNGPCRPVAEVPGARGACLDVRLDGGGNVTPAVDLATAADLIMLAPRASDAERDAAARALCDAYGAPEGLAEELMRSRRERRRAGPAAAAAAAVATAAADAESADADAEPSVAVAVAAAGPDAEAARARESAVRAAAAASLADHLRELATAAHFADMSALEERRREERARARTERLLLEERLAAERRRGSGGPADAPDAGGDSDAAAAAPGPRDFRDEIRAAASRLHVLQ